ncbi:1-deoxy-D-xylulose-5-phosphate synthase [Paucibacter sp. KBW04]|uniref:1-deoxy-D-xylulose-5-phosphate synthase n=1 Tax=Paucibacter sp. KBW04 TaxID=2153361 RepID=UPI000F576853|nr:1-deoxy-D-xylulose-5-phosphate synthase [Paucibacter sp. KBW04]RQO56984.1 1-deoxy-D-xylulose-5-phosphate synthase [Paucibacter sp. KBW04]
MKTRIMYIESKGEGLIGPARIGRVTFSKTGATISYAGRSFQSLKGAGFKSNYFDVETGDRYWISGPKKNGRDSLYATNVRPVIDADVHDEYWQEIRGLPVPPRQVDDAKSFTAAGGFAAR